MQGNGSVGAGSGGENAGTLVIQFMRRTKTMTFQKKKRQRILFEISVV